MNMKEFQNVSFQQLMQFVADYGEAYGIDAKVIAYVGVDEVLSGINAQLDPVAMVSDPDPIHRMHDYFGDGAFDHAFDVAWADDGASEEEPAEIEIPNDPVGNTAETYDAQPVRVPGGYRPVWARQEA